MARPARETAVAATADQPSAEWRLLTASGETACTADHAAVERQIGRDEFFWVDLVRAQPEDLDWLADAFDLHPLVREDLRTFGQRPKLDPYDAYSVMVFYGASHDDDGLVEVHCIFSEDYLVTVHRDTCPSFDELLHRYEGDEPVGPGPLLLHRVVDGLIDSFFPALAELDDRIDDIQDELLAQTARTEHLHQVMLMKRQLIRLRKVITPERDLVAQIVGGAETLPGLSEESLRYFRDAYDHLIRLSDMVDTYRDLLSSTLDVYLSARADRRDDVMKQLTVIATVFLPLTFITGFFGQNFRYMVDELIGSREAFVVGTLLQVATVVGILLFFRRRGWI